MVKYIAIWVMLCLLLFQPGINVKAQKKILFIPRGHSDNVECLALTPNNRFLISGGWDNALIIWDVLNGKEVKHFGNYPSWVYSLAVSPDGRWLASGSLKEIRIHDLSQGGDDVFMKMEQSGRVDDIAFSADSKLMVTAARNSTYKDTDTKSIIYIWETARMQLIKKISVAGEVQKLQINKLNQAEILTKYQSALLKINITNGDIVSREVFEGIKPDNISPDGKWLIEYGFENGTGLFNEDKHATVKIYDRQSKELYHQFNGQTSSIKDIGFSPDCRYLITSAEKSDIFIFDIANKIKSGEITHKEGYQGFVFSSDGNTLFAGNSDGSIRQYNFYRHTLESEFKSEANINRNMLISPTGKYLATLGAQRLYFKNRFLQIFDLERGGIINTASSDLMNYVAAFSKDEKYIISGKFKKNMEWFAVDDFSNSKQHVAEELDYIAMHPNGNTMATTNKESTAYQMIFRNTKTGEVQKSFRIEYAAGALAYSPQGDALYIGFRSNDKIVKVDAQSGTVIQSYQNIGEYSKSTAINKLLVSPDGSTLVSGDHSGNIRWWNSVTGKQISPGLKIPDQDVNDMLLLPGGKQFAACFGTIGDKESAIYIIDIATRKIVRKLNGHDNSPTSLGLSSNGQFLFSASYDRTVKIWDLKEAKLIATMVFFGEKDWVIVDNNGRFDGTKEGMEQLYYTSGLTIIPIEATFEKFYTPSLLPRILEGEKLEPTPIPADELKEAPVVQITYAGKVRSLEVDDDAIVIENAKVQITVSATAKGDAISEVRLFQNGKLVGNTTRNLEVVDDGANAGNKIFELDLNEGENTFKAIALNTQRTESKPVYLTLIYKPKTPAIITKTSKLYLLVVGVNTYKNPKYTLNYALADATAFLGAVKQGSSALFSETKTILLTDDKATKENIVAGLQEIQKLAEPRDMFVFYYAGHGTLNDVKDFFLVPYDVLQLYGNKEALNDKGFSTQLLQQFSKNIKAQKQLYLLDACQSAGALADVVASRGAAEEKAIAQLARATGTYWLTAAGSEQFASEFGQLGHGSFTYCILEAFKGAADNGDGKITVKELDSYLQDKVPEITQKYKGTAQYPASYNYGNDFPLIIKR